MSATSAAGTGATFQDTVGRIDFDRWRERIRSDTFANYHYHMGVALLAGGDAEAGMAALRRSIDACPSFYRAYHRLRLILEQLGRADEAHALHTRALGMDPDYEHHALIGVAEDALDRHQPAEALDILRGVEDRWPDSVGEHLGLLVAAANSFAALHRDDEATDLYRQLLRRSPDILDAHVYLGTRERNYGAVDAALDHMRHVVRLTPDDMNAWDSLNWMLLVSKDYGGALALCDQVVARDPENAYFLAYSGVARQLLGDTAAAVERLRLAATKPTDRFFIVKPFLGLVLQAAGQVDEAVATTAEGVRLAPDRAFNRAVHSICLYGAGQMKEALVEAERIVASPIPLRLPYFAQAQALLGLGRRSEAEAALKTGLARELGTLGYYTALVRWPDAIMTMIGGLTSEAT
ncbi:tetratricopeptide repeat protein [Azospirillum cavernae]|nr:tetratricopeptide repeat protein [Azospirillum cavernae]